VEKPDRIALLAATLAGAIAVVATDGNFDFLDALIGISLLLLLATYGNFKEITKVDIVIRGAAWVICLSLVVGFLVDLTTFFYSPKDYLHQQVLNFIIVGVSVSIAAIKELFQAYYRLRNRLKEMRRSSRT
jgi:hypothetical protein